jgi:hypothetical protein
MFQSLSARGFHFLVVYIANVYVAFAMGEDVVTSTNQGT